MDNGFFLPINKIKTKKFIYQKPNRMKNLTQVGVYYLSKEERRRFIIQSPKMSVFSDIACFEKNGKKSYKMSLSFKSISTLYHDQELREFRSMIKAIDNHTIKTIDKNRKEWKIDDEVQHKPSLKKIAPDAPWMISVNLPYDDEDGFLFKIYDKDAQIIDIEEIKKRKIVSVALELTEIWFNETSSQLRWNVLQMRKFSKYSPLHDIMMKQCVLADNDDPNDEAYGNLINIYRKRIQEQISYRSNVYYPPQMEVDYRLPAPIMAAPPPPPPPNAQQAFQMRNPITKEAILDSLKKLKKGKKGKADDE